MTVNALELTRTNPAHVGTAPLSSAVQAHKNAASKNSGVSETKLLDAVSSMNEQQLAVGRVEQQLITNPDSVDVHDVVTAMAKAQMSLSLAKNVIDRVVSGWNEISTTR